MSKPKTVLWRVTAWLLVIAILLAGGWLGLDYGYRHFMTVIYPLEYQQQVEAAAEQHGFPPSLIYAVIHTESGFDPAAVSSANAKGLMQLTDSTFRWALRRAGKTDDHTADALFDPNVNIAYGVYVLSLLREQFEGTDTILAAYNAGQGRVWKWLQDETISSDGAHLDTIPYTETATYIQRVTNAQQRYQELYAIQ